MECEMQRFLKDVNELERLTTGQLVVVEEGTGSK